MKKRCDWAESVNTIYLKYHDEEWGVPVHDDRLLFEFLILEGFQAGLSWSTILNKRENFKKAFDEFKPKIIADYNEVKKQNLIENPGIIRNRLKIESSIINAQKFLEIQKEYGSFHQYIWKFTDFKTKINKWKSMDEIPASTMESDEMSRDLYKRGFKFVGSKICYAYMQAVGMVNDHLVDCYRYQELI